MALGVEHIIFCHGTHNLRGKGVDLVLEPDCELFDSLVRESIDQGRSFHYHIVYVAPGH